MYAGGGRIMDWLGTRLGYTIMCASALLNVMYHSIWPPSLPWTVVPLMI